MHACTYVCIHMGTDTRTHTHTPSMAGTSQYNKQMHKYTHRHTHTPSHTHTHTHTHAHTHTPVNGRHLPTHHTHDHSHCIKLPISSCLPAQSTNGNAAARPVSHQRSVAQGNCIEPGGPSGREPELREGAWPVAGSNSIDVPEPDSAPFHHPGPHLLPRTPQGEEAVEVGGASTNRDQPTGREDIVIPSRRKINLKNRKK